MTLDQLQIFIAVAEREHVTRAAAALGLAPPSVSAAVASLEREFGTKLFHRVGRGIVVTEGGKLLLNEARDLVNRAETVKLAMREFTGLARGRLAIKASQTIASHFLPPRLVDFHQAYPGVALVVSVGNSTEVVGAIIRGDIELGFVEGPEEEFGDPRLAVEMIARDDLVIVASANHPWASCKELTVDDLAAAKWVLREDGSGTRAAFVKALDALGVPYGNLNIAIELPSNESVLTAVLAGAGATILSAHVCADAIEAGTLKHLIRRAARLANSLDIVRELLETAFHIDDMAARVEKRCGSGESYTGPPRSHVSSVARQILQSPTSRSLAFPAADCRFRPPES